MAICGFLRYHWFRFSRRRESENQVKNEKPDQEPSEMLNYKRIFFNNNNTDNNNDATKPVEKLIDFDLDDERSSDYVSQSNYSILSDSVFDAFELFSTQHFSSSSSQPSFQCRQYRSVDSAQRKIGRRLNLDFDFEKTSEEKEVSNFEKDSNFYRASSCLFCLSGKKFSKENSSIKLMGIEYANIDKLDFEFKDHLGSGQFGCVEKYLHLPSEKVLAIKRMRIHSNSQDQQRHMKNDIDLLSKCQHRFIVDFYGYLMLPCELWICMELMDTSLDLLIKCLKQKKMEISNKNGLIPEVVIGCVAVSVIQALNYMRKQHQTIHRDVKPSNILINRFGQIKLCDFGISGSLTDSLTQSKTIGSIAYVAPERISCDQNFSLIYYDVRVDVWSLGLSLLEMALGRFPYENYRNEFELYQRILQSDPPTLSKTIYKFYSSSLKSFVDQCLIKEMANRPKYDQLMKHKFYQNFFKKFDFYENNVAQWFVEVYQIN